MRIYRIAQRSMEPAIREGSYAIVLSGMRRIKDGDIIVLKHPENGMSIVKRVKKIRGKALYVVGDNADESEDSRKFGPVPMESVEGRVVCTI